MAGALNYRAAYLKGKHWPQASSRTRIPLIEQVFGERCAASGGLPFDIQMRLILFLELGKGTRDDPGYITPYCWVCKAWSQEIRRRVYTRCNIKSYKHMDWFLQSVASSVVPFPECPGVGRYITTLSISFVPPDMGMQFIRLDGVHHGGGEVEYDVRDYWERFADAVQNMVALRTLCLCYNNDPWDHSILDAYSSHADAFPPSLTTLILRPLKNQFILPDPYWAPWTNPGFAITLSKWKTITLLYLESPGYVIYPPTRMQLNNFVGRVTESFGDRLESFVIRCGYGREVLNVDPEEEDNPEQFLGLHGTPWESRTEGVNDYYLPRVDPGCGLRNRRGGIYEIRRGAPGGWIGVAGNLPALYTWSDRYDATFDFGMDSD